MLGSQEQPGVIPRAVRGVFNLVKAKEREHEGWDYSIGMSYLEIYNEKVGLGGLMFYEICLGVLFGYNCC